jgi:hypothetical protein
MRRFAADYRGEFVTETMLVAGLNDDEASVRRTARFVSALEPLRAYVSIPTRPPAEAWVRGPGMDAVRRACDRFRALEIPTSCLTEEIEEGKAPFAVSDDPAQGLLGIVAVHPMTETAARDYLARAGPFGAATVEPPLSPRSASVRGSPSGPSVGHTPTGPNPTQRLIGWAYQHEPPRCLMGRPSPRFRPPQRAARSTTIPNGPVDRHLARQSNPV